MTLEEGVDVEEQQDNLYELTCTRCLCTFSGQTRYDILSLFNSPSQHPCITEIDISTATQWHRHCIGKYHQIKEAQTGCES